MEWSQNSAEPEGSQRQAQTADSDSSQNAGSHAALRSYPCTDEPSVLLPLAQNGEDPKLQLRTQMQQLSELSCLLSQRMTADDSGTSDVAAEAALGRAGARRSPEPSDLQSSCVAPNEDDDSPDGVFAAQHAQRDPERSFRDPTQCDRLLLSTGLETEANARFEPSTGIHSSSTFKELTPLTL